MPFSLKDVAQALTQIPVDATDAQKIAIIRGEDPGKIEPGLVSKAWSAVNRPIGGSEDALIPALRHTHAENEGAIRRTAEDLGAGLTSPLNLGLTATGIGAGLAGKAGMLGAKAVAEGAAPSLIPWSGISKGARVAEAALQAPLVAEGIHGAVTGDTLGEKLGGVVEAGLGAHGMHSAATHAFDPKAVIKTYMEEHGLTPHPREAYDPDVAKVIADHYEAMPHTPNDPQTKASYSSLKSQVDEQHKFLAERAGVKMEPWTGKGEPYSGSKAMQEDVEKNNHLFFLPTDTAYGEGSATADHPMLQGGSNDKFRAVHDYFGHAAEGNTFGPKGEEAAFQAHKDTLTPDAHGALATETKGQNSWVNSGAHLRDAEGNIPTKGQPGFVPPSQRPFAEQKAGLLPGFDQQPREILESGKPYGILSAGNPAGKTLTEEENIARHQQLMDELHQMGFKPREQQGHFGGNPEPSVLVPGPEASTTKQLGKKFEQEAVISHEGWHRLADDKTFPKVGPTQFDQEAENFYSEVPQHGGKPLKYQMEFPDAAYAKAETAPSAAHTGPGEVSPTQTGAASETPLKGSKMGGIESTVSPSRHDELLRKFGGTGSTVLSVASPAVAHSGLLDDEGPDDPNHNLKAGAKLGLDVLGGGAAIAAAGWFPKRLKAKLDTMKAELYAAQRAEHIAKGGSPANFMAKDAPVDTALRAEIRKTATSYQEEKRLQDGYSALELPKHGGINFDERRPITKVLAYDKPGTSTTTKVEGERGVKLSEWSQKRMTSAYQAGEERLKSDGGQWGNGKWIYHLSNGDPETATQITRLLGAFSPGQKTDANVFNAVEGFLRASNGQPTDSIVKSLSYGHPRPSAVKDNLARAMQLGRIFGNKTEALAGAEVGLHEAIPIDMWLLRALGTETEKTPGDGTYRLISEAVTKAAKAQGENPFHYMAKVWMGMQDIAGSPTPSFADAASNLKLSGHLGSAANRAEILANLETHNAAIGEASAAARSGQPHIGAVSPIATNPKMAYEPWLQSTQDLMHSGMGKDVLGKKALPKSKRDMTFGTLLEGDRRAKAAWKPAERPQKPSSIEQAVRGRIYDDVVPF